MKKEQLRQVRQARELIKQANIILLSLCSEPMDNYYHTLISIAESTTFDLLIDNLNKVVHDAEHELYS